MKTKTTNNFLDSGAEARIFVQGDKILKVRSEKTYRHPSIDRSLRESRTQREAKVLHRLKGIAPQCFNVNKADTTLTMEFVDAPQLRDDFNEMNKDDFATKLGLLVKQLHDAGVIHGDLTTSNVLVRDGCLIPIDFGLSLFSRKVEDQAVDLYLLERALAAKHPSLDVWMHVLDAYAPSKELIERLEEVRLRGRYKHK